MTDHSCSTCAATKAPLRCGVCATALCKSCARFADDEAFSLAVARPTELAHDVYCSPCFERTVTPALDAYEETAARARDVNVFFKTQGKESRFIRRTEKTLKVEACADRDEAVLKLAYLAAAAGHNTLLDVELTSQKIRRAGWQTATWSGRGVPASVDPERLKRRFISAPN